MVNSQRWSQVPSPSILIYVLLGFVGEFASDVIILMARPGYSRKSTNNLNCHDIFSLLGYCRDYYKKSTTTNTGHNKIIMGSITWIQHPEKRYKTSFSVMALEWDRKWVGVSLFSRAGLSYLDPPSPRRRDQAVSKHISSAISGYITAISGSDHAENRSGTRSRQS